MYSAVQPVLTPATAYLPLPALDLLVVLLLLAAGWAAWRRRRQARCASTVARVVFTTLAGGWLLFLASWGWHYQVPTIEARLALVPSDFSAERAEAFARATVEQLNALHDPAHAAGWPERSQLPEVLAPRLARVLPTLGIRSAPAVVVPRRTMFDWYFRWAGIDGMTNPFGLEVLVNSRVLPVELPALAAHEYAHLAGFADESDASIVAWLACRGGGPNLQYSAALAVLPHVLQGLPPDVRRRLAEGIGPGPRQDLRAIAARVAEQHPWVNAFAWRAYDGFLKANRVDEGVARYDAVARVLIAAGDPVTGTLRRSPPAWPLPRR